MNIVEGASCGDMNKMKADINTLSSRITNIGNDVTKLINIHQTEGFVEGAVGTATRNATTSSGRQIANIQSVSDIMGEEQMKAMMTKILTGDGSGSGSVMECTPLPDGNVKEAQYITMPMKADPDMQVASMALSYVLLVMMIIFVLVYATIELIDKFKLDDTWKRYFILGEGISIVLTGIAFIIWWALQKKPVLLASGITMILVGSVTLPVLFKLVMG